MRSRDSVLHTFAFAGAVCVVCAVLVSTAAVSLRGRQQANVELDRKKNVLRSAGVLDQDQPATRARIEESFAAFDVAVVDLRSGEEATDFDATGYDPRRALASDDTSHEVPDNPAQVRRVPDFGLVYRQFDESGRLRLLVLPVQGMGLWATMYGYFALGPDLRTVRGLTYYEHGETPGLGAEVDNPRWQALWPGRVAVDEDGEPVIEVIRGSAGSVDDDPHRVDGISGATITGRGVTEMLRFWLGPHGYGPYLERLREREGEAAVKDGSRSGASDG